MNVRLAVRSTGVGAGAAAWEIRTGATPGRWKLIELHLFLASAVASVFGLGQPAVIGVTPTTPVDFLTEDPNDVLASGGVQSALAWTTGPTVPANFDHRFPITGTIGNGGIFTFPKGIVIPVSSSLVLWNITANGVVDGTAVLEL
jgi:hypothetical protein